MSCCSQHYCWELCWNFNINLFEAAGDTSDISVCCVNSPQRFKPWAQKRMLNFKKDGKNTNNYPDHKVTCCFANNAVDADVKRKLYILKKKKESWPPILASSLIRGQNAAIGSSCFLSDIGIITPQPMFRALSPSRRFFYVLPVCSLAEQCSISLLLAALSPYLSLSPSKKIKSTDSDTWQWRPGRFNSHSKFLFSHSMNFDDGLI